MDSKTLMFDVNDYQFKVTYEKAIGERLSISATHKTDFTCWTNKLGRAIDSCFSLYDDAACGKQDDDEQFTIIYSLDKFFKLMVSFHHNITPTSSLYKFKYIQPNSTCDTLKVQLITSLPCPGADDYVDIKEIPLVYIDESPTVILNKKLNSYIEKSSNQIRSLEQKVSELESKLSSKEQTEVVSTKETKKEEIELLSLNDVSKIAVSLHKKLDIDINSSDYDRLFGEGTIKRDNTQNNLNVTRLYADEIIFDRYYKIGSMHSKVPISDFLNKFNGFPEELFKMKGFYYNTNYVYGIQNI